MSRIALNQLAPDFSLLDFSSKVGLPDPRHSVLKLYGQEVKLFKFGRMPAQVLIDKAGIARFVHNGHSMSDIPPSAEILALSDEL